MSQAQTPFIRALLALIVLSFCSNSVRPQGGAPTTSPAGLRLRVGTYDSRALVVAFSATKAHSDQIKDLQTQLKTAETAGDTQRAEQIKIKGKNLQTVAHLQAFSNAPVDEIMQELKGRLSDIAREAGVDVIVANVDFKNTSVEVIDITDRLVAAFAPSEQTLKTITELLKHKPMPLVDVIGSKD